MTDLNGKVVLVTGSSRGIRAEIAVAFARQGANVVLHGRDSEALAKVQADITNGGGHAMFVTGDVTKFADIEAIRARVEQTYGLVDVLVACAGGSGEWLGIEANCLPTDGMIAAPPLARAFRGGPSAVRFVHRAKNNRSTAATVSGLSSVLSRG